MDLFIKNEFVHQVVVVRAFNPVLGGRSKVSSGQQEKHRGETQSWERGMNP